MGRFLVLQPNRKFAIWSSIVNDFVYLNLTEEDVIEIHRDFAGKQGVEYITPRLEMVKRGQFPNYYYPTYEEALLQTFMVHSSKQEFLKYLLELSKSRTKSEIKKLLDSKYSNWMYHGGLKLYNALLDYVTVVSCEERKSSTFEDSKRLLKENKYF